MTALSSVKQANNKFSKEEHEGCVAVFVGATSGIGAATLERVVQMLNSSTFYILGRSKINFTASLARLQALSSNCKLIFVETDLSLLGNIDAACRQIIAAEKKVDYLFMSAGMVPFAGAQCKLTFNYSFISKLRDPRHERRTGKDIHPLVLQPNPSPDKPAPSSSSSSKTACAERTQCWKRANHGRD